MTTTIGEIARAFRELGEADQRDATLTTEEVRFSFAGKLPARAVFSADGKFATLVAIRPNNPPCPPADMQPK
jgi:hypothetical protein